MSKVHQLKFYTIDDWNRPVFKVEINSRTYFFGSTSILFDYSATEEDVKKKVELGNLEYFGTEFDADPMGTPIGNFKDDFVIV